MSLIFCIMHAIFEGALKVTHDSTWHLSKLIHPEEAPCHLADH